MGQTLSYVSFLGQFLVILFSGGFFVKLRFLVPVLMFPLLAIAQTPSTVESSFMDKSVDPCEDFYQYACGSWIKNTELPSDRPIKSRGFSDVEELNEKSLLKIVESYSKGKNVPSNPDSQKIGSTYSACIDEASIERIGNRDFKIQIKPILALNKKEDIAMLLSDLHLKGVNVLFKIQPDEDLKNPQEKIMTADQGGMGLPTNGYYLADDSNMAALRGKYQEFAQAGLQRAGFSEELAKVQAKKVLDLEIELAKASLAPDERRNPEKLHHRLEKKGLVALAPEFNWQAYFEGLGIPNFESINVAVPTFFSALNSTLKTADLATLKSYLIVRIYARSASAMDKKAVNDYFKFYSSLFGISELPPRYRRCLSEVGDIAGFALGRAFVDQTFSAGAKASVQGMVQLLHDEMKKNLEHIEWMDSGTRIAALRKLEKQTVYVGYPDKWRDYSKLKVTRKSMLVNRFNGSEFNFKYELSKLGKPVDKSEWTMKPMEVNASNMVSQNVIYFPAGFLQPPNFVQGRDAAANFGALGMVIGHEITHGYDDQGRSFDENGAVRNWWSDKTNQEFEKRAQCIVNQYSEYLVSKDLKVNGKLAAGEAIGDLGGLKLAFAALKSLRAENPKTEKSSKEEFSEDQTFFLAAAQAWCSKGSPAFERFVTNSDPHPLDRFRVNGTVRNIPEFAKSFSCKTGAKLAPKVRCEVW
jgi:putative endopeptidase